MDPSGAQLAREHPIRREPNRNWRFPGAIAAELLQRRSCSGSDSIPGSVAPVFSRHAPEARVGERAGSIFQIEICALITFPLEGKNCVGAGIDSAVNAAGEMNSEKRKSGIRYGINEIADQIVLSGTRS